MLYPPLWFFLFCHRFKLSLLVRWRELCACTCWKHCRLYKLLHFAYVLVLSWNFRVHRISRPPCRKSVKYFLLPVTLHKIVPFFLRNNEQIADIFLGTWPTVVSSFTIARGGQGIEAHGPTSHHEGTSWDITDKINGSVVCCSTCISTIMLKINITYDHRKLELHWAVLIST